MSSVTRLALLPLLRRRLWIVILLAVIAGGVAAVVARGAVKSYSATGFLVVPANGQTALGQPDNASGAEGLAENYATLLPQDPAFNEAVLARSVHSSAAADAVENVTMTSIGRTAVIRVSTTSSSSAAAVGYFRALSATIAQTPPASSNLIPGTLRVLQQPTGTSVSSDYERDAPIVAVLAGALFGLLLSLLIERARPRVDRVEDAARVSGLWAIDLRTSAAEAALSAQTRLGKARRDGRKTPDLAVLGVGRRARQSASWSSGAIERALASLSERQKAAGRSGHSLDVGAGGDPRQDSDAVWLAQAARECWLTFPVGTKVAAVEQALRLLENCDVQATTVVLGPARPSNSSRRPTIAVAPVEDAPQTALTRLGEGPRRHRHEPAPSSPVGGRADTPHTQAVATTAGRPSPRPHLEAVERPDDHERGSEDASVAEESNPVASTYAARPSAEPAADHRRRPRASTKGITTHDPGDAP